MSRGTRVRPCSALTRTLVREPSWWWSPAAGRLRGLATVSSSGPAERRSWSAVRWSWRAAVVLVVGRVVVGRVVVGRVVVVPPVDGPVVAVEGVVVEVEVLTPVGPVLEGGDGVTPPASTGAKKADAPKRLMAVPRAANPRER